MIIGNRLGSARDIFNPSVDPYSTLTGLDLKSSTDAYLARTGINMGNGLGSAADIFNPSVAPYLTGTAFCLKSYSVLADINRGFNDGSLNDHILHRLGLDVRALQTFQRLIEAMVEYPPEQILDLIRRIESILRTQFGTATLQTVRSTVDEVRRNTSDIRDAVGSVAQSQPQEAEFANVLFMDIVAYSKLTTNQQTQNREKLKNIVRSTAEFVRLNGNSEKLICRSTGDGMALVFFGSPEIAVRCAIQIGQTLKRTSELKLRMGVHTGSVNRDRDINDQLDVAGGGINGAQRVMDCGDDGHILVSRIVAEFLKETGGWESHLRDLGETAVKHGERIHIYNLVTRKAGNPEMPRHYSLEQNKSVNSLE